MSDAAPVPVREAIRFGLAAIKNVGEGPVRSIALERDRGGAFTSLTDFLRRADPRVLNKKTLEALTRSGALDRFAPRGQLVASVELMGRFARDYQRGAPMANQHSIFDLLADAPADSSGEFQLVDAPEAGIREVFAWEKELLGFPVSANPMAKLGTYLRNRAKKITALSPRDVGQKVTIGGMLVSVKKISTKAGVAMGFATVEDASGRIEITFFPRTWEKVAPEIREDGVYLISGKVDQRNGELGVLVDSLKEINLDRAVRTDVREAEREPVILKFSERPDAETFAEIKAVLEEFPGEAEVIVEIAGDRAIARARVRHVAELRARLHELGAELG